MNAHFVVLPPEKVLNMAGLLGEKYSSYFVHDFAVDNKKLIPHITLFSLEIGPSRIRAVYKEVQKELKNFKKLNLTISRHSLYAEPNGACWLGLKIKNSDSLLKLRKGLFKAIHDYDPKAKQLKHYSPHITLTRFRKKSQALQAVKNSTIPLKFFSTSAIAICHDAKFWQVKKVVKKFNLHG